MGMNVMEAGEAARVFTSADELHRVTGLPMDAAQFALAVLEEPNTRFRVRIGRAGREYPEGTSEWSANFWTSDPAASGRCIEFLPGPGSDDCTFAWTLREFTHTTGAITQAVGARLGLSAAPCPFNWWNEYVVGSHDFLIGITTRWNFWRKAWAQGPPPPPPPAWTEDDCLRELRRNGAADVGA